ncbi:RSP_2647 family RNA methyltransferase [Halovulum sp. GXIMD14793]
MTDTLPILRLRPKVNLQPLRFGAPWAYADQLVLDRRSRAITPGSFVQLQDAERRPLGVGTLNPASKIAFRMMDRDPEVRINADWIRTKLSRALSLRDRLYDAPFYRLIHAEADGLPGLIIDRFADAIVLQPNAAWAEAQLDLIVEALVTLTDAKTVIKNASGRARQLEGLDDASAVLQGEVNGPVDVLMNGAIYKADILGGQKTGLFYDQRPNHAFAASLCKDAHVLDVFSHVGGFALAALAAGAATALSVDGSAPALDLARQGAESAGFSDRFETRQGDAFDVMTALVEEGARFDAVICDPPAFAPAKPALEAGLRAYERVARLAASLVQPGGFLVLCSCSHAAGLDKFRTASLRGVGRAGRSAQILQTGAAGPDHPTHPYLAESAYLKAIFLRLD